MKDFHGTLESGGADRLVDEAQSLAEREEGAVLPVPDRRHVPWRLLSGLSD